jgi:transposase
MNVHVGMDVHPKRSQIVFLDAAGGEQRSRNLANDPVKLVPVFGVLPPGTPVAFEAAYGWAWLVELLEELKQEPHLVHPSCCKAIAAARLKNDKVDARTLASCCGPTCSPRPGSPHPSRDRNGGFQIGNEQSSPLARGPQPTATP